MAEDHNDEILAAIAEKIKAQGDDAVLDLSNPALLRVEQLLKEKIQAQEPVGANSLGEAEQLEERLPSLTEDEEKDVEEVAGAVIADIEAAVAATEGLELADLSDEDINELVDAMFASN